MARHDTSWDRPREHWRMPDGGLTIFTRSLDLDSLLVEAK
jgi:catechol-2,3-dioxygenase